MAYENISAGRWAVFHQLSNKWIQTNKHLMKGCTEPSQFMGFNEAKNEININMDVFSDEYTHRFIVGKLNGYANGLIEKFTPVLKEYLNKIEVGEGEFTFIFRQRLSSMYKYIKVTL